MLCTKPEWQDGVLPDGTRQFRQSLLNRIDSLQLQHYGTDILQSFAFLIFEARPKDVELGSRLSFSHDHAGFLDLSPSSQAEK